MKKLNFSRVIIALAVILTGTLPSFAHDFEVDGIYYDYIYGRSTEISVTYKGSNSNSYSNEYTGSVVIPSSVTYNGTTYSVVSIGREAFSNCNSLTSVTIPNSVTTIDHIAFSNCDGLTSVTIPESVISIGSGAFYDCDGLTTVNFNAKNCTFDYYDYTNVFGHCENLTNLNIGEKVCVIHDQIFSYCSGLTTIIVENGNTVYDSRDNCNAIIETKTNALITGCKNTTMPESVTSIGDRAFYGCIGLTLITIPNSVTSIGNYAFSDCNSLTSVTIPDSVASIRGYAFSDCLSLTSITIPNSVTYIGSSAFSGCRRLTSIVVDSGNSKYDSRDNCNAIIATKSNTIIAGCKNTIIPNSVTSIGDDAFSGCYELTSITIPNSVTKIGDDAFFNCVGLTSITIPNSVTKIGDDAFSNCNGLTSITISNSVTKIGDGAFYHCDSLTEVNYNAENCTSMGSSSDPVFGSCRKLKTINIGNSVKTIPSYAFSGCSGLTGVTIPNSVTSIGSDAFGNCKNLLGIALLGETPPAMPSGFISDRKDFIIVVPTGCVDIYKNDPNWAQFTEIYAVDNKYLHFTQTSNNKCYLSSCEETASGKIEIPKIVIIDGVFCEVTSIEEYAFVNCTGLTSVTIPNSVTSIGNYAFNLCTNLAEVIIEDGKETLSLGYNFYNHNYYSAGRGLFYDCPLEKIYLGRNLDYDTSMDFGYSPFYNNSKIKEITIGNSVTKIGNKAFDLCINLKLVINLSNLYFIKGTQGFGYIAYYANRVINAPNGYIDGDFIWAEKDSVNKLLAYIGNATEVTIPNSVTTIGYDAFSNCTSLTEVNISDISAWYKIDFANEYANPLYYAGHLKLNGTEITNLVIPDDIYQIKRHTFVGCTGLTSVTIPNSVTSIGAGAFSGSGLRLIFSYCMTPPACGDGAFNGCYAARLMVPEGTYYDYLVANEWYKFEKIQEIAGVEGIEFDEDAVEVARYDIYGRQLTEPTKGINIIKMSDGSTRKEYVK